MAGTVETIDDANRMVTIRTDAGDLVTVKVPGFATRFNELKVGDKVKATSHNTVIVILKPPGEPPGDTCLTLRAGGEDERPGGAMGIERWMTVTVNAIDTRRSSSTFSGPHGWHNSRRVPDPTVRERLKVGDKLDVMGNTNVTVAVEERSWRTSLEAVPGTAGDAGRAASMAWSLLRGMLVHEEMRGRRKRNKIIQGVDTYHGPRQGLSILCFAENRGCKHVVFRTKA
jgi:hypothetical protein